MCSYGRNFGSAMESENNSLIDFSNSSQINGQRSLYKRRWIILFVVSLINICNAGVRSLWFYSIF